jgi:photosystem II stability/assembly factor-like uncharacterized protein
LFTGRRGERSSFFCLLVLISVVSTFSFCQQFSPTLYEGMRWRMIGPFRGGRTVAISGVPGASNVFYIAANNGGVWKTTDYGHTWQPIFDDQPTGSIGALAIAPSDPGTIYVGSGEGLRRPDLSTGDGIYKSTDAGRTWQHLGLRDAQQISAIIVDPLDPKRLFVAALGHPYGPNEERGVFRSTDGGLSWQKVLYKNTDTGAIDLAFDPSNVQTIYAVMWASRRPPWTTGGAYSAAGGGLYKSTDGGTTWNELTKGLPSGANLGRIGLAIAPSDPSRMYAIVDSKTAGGVYRTDDAGTTWQQVNSETRIWGRADDFAGIRVHPKDRDTIFIANTSTYRSSDAGKTFTAIKGAPGGDDYHTIWLNPENPHIIALASDQGATISVNDGATWSSWYNQPTAQFYHVITDNQFPYWVYGGQQESGSIGIASRSDYGSITFRDWYPVGVEEYGYVAPDPLNPNLIYGGKATRFDKTTMQTQDISPVVLRTGKYRFNRTAPMIFSPVDPHILYLGSNVLFKTTDGGKSWQTISPDLTREDPGTPSTLGVFAESDQAKGKHRGVIYSIAPSPTDVNLVWLGTDDGLIHVTRNGGRAWREVTPPELTPWSKVAQMDASHFDADTVYAAVNRFRLDDLHPYIYRTHDGGRTWQKIVAGLPDNEPVNTVREDPQRKGLLFAGTERSVYVSFNDGDQWQPLRLNLPATSIRDLVVHQDDLVIGTHGRSFWILDDITPLRQMTTDVASAPATLFTPQLTYRVRRSTNTDTPLPPEVPAGQNPPDGAVIDYVIGSGFSGPAILEISDSSGKVVRHFSSTDQPAPLDTKELNVPTYWVRPERTLSASSGMHRFVWDLRLSPPDTLEHEYPISAIPGDTPRGPQGPAVVPGDYKVTLAANGKTYTQPLHIQMDPRVKASAADLAQQFTLETQIADAMHQDYTTLMQIRNLRAQVGKIQSQGKLRDLAPALKDLESKAAALEGDGSGATFLSTSEGNSFTKLNAGLSTLLGIVDSADVAPTTQAVAMFARLQSALTDQTKQWEQVQAQEVASLNSKLKRAGAKMLDPKVAVAP